MPTRKENSVAAGREAPRIRASRIVEPERDEPGRSAAINWPIPTATTTAQEIWSVVFLPRSKQFHSDEKNAADEERPSHGLRRLGQLKPLLFHDVARQARDAAGDENLRQIGLAGGIAPAGEHREPAPEERQHREDSAPLDDDIEQIALPRQPVFRDEEMPGGGDGNEFGESLDEAENKDDEPGSHE